MSIQTTAQVLLGERLVGMLSMRAGRVTFQYTDRGLDRPVLGLAYEYNPRKRETAPGGQLPPWFANLLPERESGLRRLITAQLGLKSVADFSLLVHLGQDLPGAVRVVCEEPGLRDSEAERAWRRPDARKMSFSLAGIQVKLSMVRTTDKFLYEGTGGDWIVKFPSDRHDLLPENEHAMMTWLAMSGITVPPHELVPADSLVDIPDGLTLDHFRRFAETVGADQEKVTAAVSATVEAMVSSWPSVRRECPVPSFVAAHIEARLRTLPLLKSR